MFHYTVSQWIFIFFWYCFLGWIWECCYVSVVEGIKNKKWKWINRGFLNGPMLPIYGFAAISILIGTMNVRDSIPLVFIMGALAATIMELVTGSVMERLFHVKYWDYSNMPLNYKGYICFFVSLFWGVLSVILVDVIHVPIENVLLQCPIIAIEIIAFLLMGIFAYDFHDSLNAALDVKELLEKLSEKFSENHPLHGKVLLHLEKTRSRRLALHLKHNPTAISKKYKEAFEELKEFLKDRK